jgi:Tfp pilus assembly protein PilO
MDAKRQWVLVTALMGIAILIAGFMFVVRPQYSKADSLHNDAKSVSDQTQVLNNRLAVLQSEENQLPAKKAALAKLTTKIPAAANLPDLTRSLQAAAQNIPQPPVSGRAVSALGHVDLSLFSPGAPTALTAAAATGTSSSSSTSTSSSTSASAAGAAGAAAVQQIPLTVTISGSFFNVEAFLDRLESMDRAILVDGFGVTYQGSNEDPLLPNSGEVTVNITARAFLTTAPLTAATAQ